MEDINGFDVNIMCRPGNGGTPFVRRMAGPFLTLAVLVIPAAPAATAAPHAGLQVVRPLVARAGLIRADLHEVAETRASVGSAETVQTPKGPICKVVSQIDPAIIVTTYLPAERWTQRYYQAAGVVAGPNGYP